MTTSTTCPINPNTHILLTPFAQSKLLKHYMRVEMINGRWATLGIIAGVGAYVTTGQLIPGFV
tara:strand:+ start:285 stop:473 length:189 start_codon:yes stop_codon:yes gene_type:complete